MEIRKAERKQAKIKMAIQGCSGSGKTYSALLIANGLIDDWSNIIVIDTENNSADLYDHLGEYRVLPLSPPFTPERYIKAIQKCEEEGGKVIILDSISHEWEGAGGILEVHGNMPGNSFTNWNKVTPRHNAFVESMLQSRSHIIATVRTKQNYVLNERNGKQVPEKVGMKGITRDGLDYEFTIVLDMDMKHIARVSKNRTSLFQELPEFVPNIDTGQQIRKWCESGTSIEQVKGMIIQCTDRNALLDLYNKYPEYRDSLQKTFSKRKHALLNHSTN